MNSAARIDMAIKSVVGIWNYSWSIVRDRDERWKALDKVQLELYQLALVCNWMCALNCSTTFTVANAEIAGASARHVYCFGIKHSCILNLCRGLQELVLVWYSNMHLLGFRTCAIAKKLMLNFNTVYCSVIRSYMYCCQWSGKATICYSNSSHTFLSFILNQFIMC